MSKLQHRGTEGSLLCGIGIVNLIQASVEAGTIFPLDCRFQAREAEA